MIRSDLVTELGLLAMRRQRDRVEQLLASGIDKGARLAAEGRWSRSRLPIELTLFTDADNPLRHRVQGDFGPVTSLRVADDEKRAIEPRDNAGLRAQLGGVHQSSLESVGRGREGTARVPRA